MANSRNIEGKVRVLVAPLDWGLGHATRSVPIIRELLARNVEVILAGEGASASLLTGEFPTLQCIDLPGYRAKYAKSAGFLPFKIIMQMPRLAATIKREHQWLQQVITDHRIDAVISDNRYGLYHKTIPCIFITHQLSIRAGNAVTEKILRWLNYRYINRFTECWVPDEKGPDNYAGLLSHPPTLPSVPVRYTGILSRLTASDEPVVARHLFVSLSGPEPQRSLLETTLVDQLSHYNFSATLVRGLPQEERMLPSTNSLRFYNHLNAEELGKEMAKADLVITRSGYSTVMDLVTMDKKAILVPTPGQTEQEYLGTYLMEKGFAVTAKQKDFNLEHMLKKAMQFFSGRDLGGMKKPHHGSGGLKAAVEALLERVSSRR